VGIINILLVGFLTLLLFLYLRRGFSIFSLLRLFGLVLAIILITNLVIHFTDTRKPKDVIILLDVSESMKGEKLAIAERVAKEFAARRKESKIFPFAENVAQRVGEALKGMRTDIAQALRWATNKRPGAILLISDGLHNTEEDPVSFVRKSKTPIYTIAVGKEEGRDLAITDCLHPERANKDESLKIRVQIKAVNISGERDLSLRKDGRLLEKRKISFADGEYYKEEEFNIQPQKIGIEEYQIVIDSIPGEDSYENNRRNFSIAIRERKRKIYYISNSPTFNLKFIKGVLTEDKDNEINILISLDGQEFYKYPDFKERFTNFLDMEKEAIVIFDNLRFGLLAPVLRTQLRDLSFNCRGILFLAGEEDYREIEEWLPTISEGKVINKEIEPIISQGMRGSQIFYQGDENLLENSPPFLGIRKTRPKEKAIVWWTSSEGPLLSYWLYKEKKIVQLTGFPFWRWFFSPDENQINRKKFLSNLLDFFLFGEERFYIKTDKPKYYSGEEIKIRLLATDERGMPWQNLDFTLITDKGDVVIPMTERGNGIYEANILLPPGKHRLRAVAYERGEKRGETETIVKVEEMSLEQLRTGVDKKLLSLLSEASGGKSFSVDNYDFGLPSLAEYKREFKLIPQRTPYLYLLITSVFILEWVLRKRRGLP